MTTYLVLGLGLQGTAAAHDLIAHGGASRLILVDSDAPRLAAAKARLEALTGFTALETHEFAVATDAVEACADLRAAFDAAELAMNCLPYRFSEAMTSLALDAGCHIADLGGNTAIVRRQLELAAAHPRGKHTAVLPDCGLMCEPSGPLDYALLFNVYGLINEYFGKAQVLRAGQLVEIDTFGELEDIAIDFAARGLTQRDCEAFITSGGLSTTPWTFADKIGELDYKTVRYRGHHEKFKLLVDLGLLAEDAIELPRGGSAIPRDVLAAALTQTLTVPEVDDFAFLRCTAKAGERTLELEMFDRKSETTGFTAMERTTAYSATACLTGVLSGHTRPAAGPIEAAVDTAWYLEALGARGIEVLRSIVR